MADPSTYRPAPGEIPDAPGVYRFRDARKRVIYVGKAKSLRSRVSSYFQDIANLHQRTATMVTTAASVEWTVVQTEVEALQLEYSWIKEFDPRFNVKYRDDKSYPWLAVTLNEEYPRVMVGRGAKKKGVRYFGPYSHAWAIRETVDLLLRVFPMRSCSAGCLQAQRTDRQTVPARLYRQMLRALRRARQLPRSIARSSTTSVPSSAVRRASIIKRLEKQMTASLRRPGVRARGPAARRCRRAQAGDGAKRDRAGRRHRC